MRPFWLFVFAPVIALAQAAAPTEFPSDSTLFTAEALKERVTGNTFTFKPLAGDVVRIQYQATYAFFNVGSVSDSGKWRVEGSSICYEWKNFQEAARSIEVSATWSMSSASAPVKWWCFSPSESQHRDWMRSAATRGTGLESACREGS